MFTFNVWLGFLPAGADFCVLVTEHTLKVFSNLWYCWLIFQIYTYIKHFCYKINSFQFGWICKEAVGKIPSYGLRIGFITNLLFKNILIKLNFLGAKLKLALNLASGRKSSDTTWKWVFKHLIKILKKIIGCNCRNWRKWQKHLHQADENYPWIRILGCG